MKTNFCAGTICWFQTVMFVCECFLVCLLGELCRSQRPSALAGSAAGAAAGQQLLVRLLRATRVSVRKLGDAGDPTVGSHRGPQGQVVGHFRRPAVRYGRLHEALAAGVAAAATRRLRSA